MADDEHPGTAPGDEVRTEGSGTVVVLLGANVRRRDIPRLCRRLRTLLERDDAHLVICDAGVLTDVDLVAVDALARLQLTARRLGREFRVRGASWRLRALLVLTGLYDTVPTSPPTTPSRLSREVSPGRPLRPCGQPEEREQRRGVEERVDPGDPPV